MSLPAAGALALLALWGIVVAVDLVSLPQALYSRPIVAGAVAGLILGDVATGLRLGLLLELFALDVLPVGASRYPDHGPATVAAVAALSGSSWPDRVGLSVLLALSLAVLGGWAMQRLRNANAQALQARAAALAAGSASAIRTLHWAGLARDVVRGATIMVVGLAGALAGRAVPPAPPRWEALAATIAVGGGLLAAGGGAFRSAGLGQRFHWLVAGAVLGVILGVGLVMR